MEPRGVTRGSRPQEPGPSSAVHDLQDGVADLLVQHELRVRGYGLEHLRIEDEFVLGGFADQVSRAQAPDEIPEQRTIEEIGRAPCRERVSPMV